MTICYTQNRRVGALTNCVYLNLSLLVCLQQYDQKNIRRRVYDALNVLMAMNIIYKDKKDIHWVGLPTNSAQEVQALQVITLDLRVHASSIHTRVYDTA